MYSSGGHLSGSVENSWCKQIQKRRHKINQGKRARHSATLEAAPDISGWFKKVRPQTSVSKVFQELSCRRPSCCLISDSNFVSHRFLLFANFGPDTFFCYFPPLSDMSGQQFAVTAMYKTQHINSFIT